jgi:Fe-S-cluster containining protein
MVWKCDQCGKCCTFIVIPVEVGIDGDTVEWIEAHGIKYENGKLYIPARCEYLTPKNRCSIHLAKFSNCKAGGKKECEESKRGWEILNP